MITSFYPGGDAVIADANDPRNVEGLACRVVYVNDAGKIPLCGCGPFCGPIHINTTCIYWT